MKILQMLSGPLIGAIIGYFTNMLAVKMLFYPKREVYLFGHRLPFTPGVIPKGRPRLAKSVGQAIEGYLLTNEDIEKVLLSEATENKITNIITEMLSRNLREEICSVASLDERRYEEEKVRLCGTIGREIMTGIQEAGFSEAVVNELGNSIREKTKGTIFKAVINDKMIASFQKSANERLTKLIDDHGAAIITPVIEKGANEIESKTGLELLERFDIDEAGTREVILRIYRSIVSANSAEIISGLKVSELVESRINGMPIDELENLVQDVMKKELNAIVNLGALIGFVLGLFNILI